MNAKERQRLTDRLRNRYKEAAKDVYQGLYTPKMISVLTEMARNDIWPDGNFSDEECCVWGMIHIAVECGKVKEA